MPETPSIPPEQALLPPTPNRSVDIRSSSNEAARIQALRRMKLLATALLGVVTIGFVVARTFEGNGGWIGYLRAGCEAAMVGALADWFAVTALFRHPLGIPIPHTAIVAERKNEIGRGLGEFVESNFLTAEVLGPKIAALEPAQRAARWLVTPANTETTRRRIADAAEKLLDSLDDAEIATMVEGRIALLIAKYPPAPTTARLLRNAGANSRRAQFVDGLLKRAHDGLWDNRDSLAHQFISESPWWVPNSIDQRMFDRLFGGITATLGAMRADHNHELRLLLDRKIDRYLTELETSPELAAKFESAVEELLQHQALRSAIESWWDETKTHLRTDLANADSVVSRRIVSTVHDQAAAVLEDPERSHSYNDRVQRFVVGAVNSYGHELSALIASTVERWDTDETVTRIEQQIGRDLQFIRINGTLVGGLVGIMLHVVGKFL